MSTMNRHYDRPILEQFSQADQIPVLVGHREQRHLITDLRCALPSARGLQTGDEPVHGVREYGPAITDKVGDDLEFLAK
jgi:hypothetical protein